MKHRSTTAMLVERASTQIGVAKTVNGNTFKLAAVVVAATFVCSHAGTDTRNFLVSHFLEPARLGLEFMMSNIDDEN